MFGGIAFLLNGKMCCGVVGQDLVLRLGNHGTTEVLKERVKCTGDFVTSLPPT
jgi:hypothetical protein